MKPKFSHIFLKYLIMIYLPILLLMSGIVFIFYNSATKRDRLFLKSSEITCIDRSKDIIIRFLRQASSDLKYLSELSSLKGFIVNEGVAGRMSLSRDLFSFCSNKRTYDQVRFIDKTGMEVARINFNNGQPKLVAQEELQDKSGRYYFQDTYNLSGGQVFVSSFDLNVEQGKIEMPPKPTIRFGIPVFDDNGIRQGVFLLNYLGQILLDDLSAQMGEGSFKHFIMLNGDGYFLRGLSGDDEWGFMYNNDKTFVSKFPDAWQDISSLPQGQFETKDGFFTFNTVYPFIEAQQYPAETVYNAEKIKDGAYFWKIISFIPKGQLYAASRKAMRYACWFFASFAILWLLAYINIALLILKRRESVEHLKEISKRESGFVANVAHEIKNPLHIIRESLSIILEEDKGTLGPAQKDFTEMAKMTMERLSRLVNDLLDIAKIEAGVVETRRENMDIGLLLDEVLSGYAGKMSKKQIILKKDIPENIGLIWADRDKISEVMINLLDNALKYTPDNGKITIRIRKDEKEARFEIADTGPGIPQEYLEKIFDKFERVTAESQEGAGLGLPIAKDIVALHKGSIWVESEVGKGSKFIFTLPIDSRAK